MRIVLVHNSYQQPGGEDVVFDLERQLLERAGHQVVVYRRSNWELEGSSAFRWPMQAINTIWSTDTRQAFAKVLAREQPQLVHIHNIFVMVSPSIYSVCKEAGIPVVQTLHNYKLLCPATNFFRNGKVCEECVKHSLLRAVRYGCYRGSRPATATVALTLAVHRLANTWNDKVNVYIAPTDFARKKFLEAGLPAEKIAVKPNFVHPDPCSKDAGATVGQRQPSLSERRRQENYTLFVGRLSPNERVRTLLKAWERIPGRIPLRIVGTGPERAELEGEAAQRGLTSVSFLGQLSREATFAAIKGARFLIFPSEWYETFGLGIAEAFACGVPVISSRLGAMEEIVDNLRTGLHFTPGDPDDLATKVQWAWTSPKEMEAMGREARREYEAKYTAERNYPMLMEIYERAIGGGSFVAGQREAKVPAMIA
jgi:glycosyltransferase involved in cell wall biosynthesis